MPLSMASACLFALSSQKRESERECVREREREVRERVHEGQRGRDKRCV
jgi:hypothetical protein